MDVHPSKHNGSYAKLQECVEELQREGYDGYKVKTLAQIRQTTIDFPQARRHDGITFWLHHDAGNPDVLDAVVRQARSKRVTALYVRSPGPVPGTHQPRIHERGTPRSQAAWRCAGEAAGCARRAYPPCRPPRATRARASLCEPAPGASLDACSTGNTTLQIERFRFPFRPR